MQSQALKNVRDRQMRVSGYQQQRESGASFEVPNIERLFDRLYLCLSAPVRPA
jgi:hypothetical protein